MLRFEKDTFDLASSQPMLLTRLIASLLSASSLNGIELTDSFSKVNLFMLPGLDALYGIAEADRLVLSEHLLGSPQNCKHRGQAEM